MLVAVSGPPRLVIKCPTFGWIRGNIKKILEKLGPCLLVLVCPPYGVIWTTLGYLESESKVRNVRFDIWNARGNMKTQSKHSLYA